jgi:hypothetical protein
MTDPRPRPRYGEYSTPEVQARAKGLPEATPVTATGPESAPATPVRAHAAAARSAAPGPADSTTVPDRPRSPERATPGGLLNRVVTLGLLALGLFNFFSGFAAFLTLPTFIQTAYDQLGAGEYGPTALASALGIVAIVVSGALWLGTAWICLRLLQRGRTSWWVPLVGAAATVIALTVIMSVAILSDPTFAAFTAGLD